MNRFWLDSTRLIYWLIISMTMAKSLTSKLQWKLKTKHPSHVGKSYSGISKRLWLKTNLVFHIAWALCIYSKEYNLSSPQKWQKNYCIQVDKRKNGQTSVKFWNLKLTLLSPCLNNNNNKIYQKRVLYYIGLKFGTET